MENEQIDPAVPSSPEALSRPSAAAGLAAIPRIFYAPRSVYEEIKDGLPWWPALLVLLFLSAVFLFLFSPYMAEAFHSMIQTGEMDFPVEEIKDMSLDEFVAKARLFIVPIFVVGTVLALLLATLFYWLAVIISFGSTSFGRVFTVKIYAGYIALLFGLLTLVYMRMTSPEFSNMEELSAAGLDLSLALVMGEASGFLVRILREIHVFAIWELLVFNAGVAFLISRRWGQTIWPIAIIFLLGILTRTISG